VSRYLTVYTKLTVTVNIVLAMPESMKNIHDTLNTSKKRMKNLQLSTKILMGEVVFLVVMVGILSALHYPKLLPMNVYLFLHILGAVMFIGNIVVTGVWMFFAERTKDKKIIMFAVRMVNWADVFFTGPGVTLLFLNGLLMAPYCDDCRQGLLTRWVLVGISLFAVSGILWATLLVYQNTLLRSLTANPRKFYKTLHRWYLVGIINTIIPLIILVVMTVKPAF